MNTQKPAKDSPKQEILFLPQEVAAKASPDESVLEVALRYKVPLNHSCGGMGTCTTCRVYVEQGLEKLGPRTEFEQERSEERFFAKNERLSCQIPAHPGLIIRLP